MIIRLQTNRCLLVQVCCASLFYTHMCTHTLTHVKVYVGEEEKNCTLYSRPANIHTKNACMLHAHNITCIFSESPTFLFKPQSYFKPFILTTSSQSLYYCMSLLLMVRFIQPLRKQCVLLNCVLESLGTRLFIS